MQQQEMCRQCLRNARVDYTHPRSGCFDIGQCYPPNTKELLVGLNEEDKREMVSFMGSVNAQARNTLQVQVQLERPKSSRLNTMVGRVLVVL